MSPQYSSRAQRAIAVFWPKGERRPACHPRHSLSIEIARRPSTCGQCHLEPDAPAYNVYKESKHGNIFESKKSEWTWDNGLADPTNPFDETIERLWTRHWLFYANSARYGSAMMGPDYLTFKNGWWALTRNLHDMMSLIKMWSDH